MEVRPRPMERGRRGRARERRRVAIECEAAWGQRERFVE